MENEILDDIFTDDLRNQLKPNEKVVWDGRPAISSFTKWSNILGVIIITLFILNIYIKGWNFSSIVYPIIAFSITLWRLFQSRKVRYLITDQRIIFQLWEKKKKQLHSISLHEIKNILITDEDKNNGTILLQMKNEKIKPFKTHDFKNSNERPHVSLEMIENVVKVAEYIELGMQTK